MFGFDDEELERTRKRNRGRLAASGSFGDSREARKVAGPWGFRWWVVALETLVLVTGLSIGAVAWVLVHPEWIEAQVGEATEGAKFTVSFGDVEWLPIGHWLEPSTWRFALHDFAVDPRDPDKTDFVISRIEFPLPDIGRLYRDSELYFPWARVVGLHIQAHQQRPPPAWQPVAGLLARIEVDELELWAASYSAPDDPPLGAAHVDRVFGRFTEVSYGLPQRELSGRGGFTAPALQTGSILVTRVDLPEVVFERSTAEIEGTVLYGEVATAVKASVTDFHRKPEVRIDADLRNAPIARIVTTASGENSPITGRVNVLLSVYAGGELPRGGAWMEGQVHLTNARIPLKDNASNIIKDVVRVAPGVSLSDTNEVVLGDMNGQLRLYRGSVEIPNLIYEAPKRQISLRGHVASDDLLLVVRLIPLKNPDTRAGLGLVIYGTPKHYLFRLAKKEDLLPDVYGEKAQVVEGPKRERKPLIVLGKKDKKSGKKGATP